MSRYNTVLKLTQDICSGCIWHLGSRNFGTDPLFITLLEDRFFIGANIFRDIKSGGHHEALFGNIPTSTVTPPSGGVIRSVAFSVFKIINKR